MRAFLFLAFILITSCGKKETDAVNLQIEIPSVQQLEVEKNFLPLVDASSYAPTTVSGFNCFLVNVIGEGIGNWSGNENRVEDGMRYTYPGVLSEVVSATTGGTISITLKKGALRYIQLLGLVSNVGCPSKVSSSDLLNASKFPGVFLVGNTLKDIFKSEQITIRSAYSQSAATDARGSESLPYPVPSACSSFYVRSGGNCVPDVGNTMLRAHWSFEDTQLDISGSNRHLDPSLTENENYSMAEKVHLNWSALLGGATKFVYNGPLLSEFKIFSAGGFFKDNSAAPVGVARAFFGQLDYFEIGYDGSGPDRDICYRIQGMMAGMCAGPEIVPGTWNHLFVTVSTAAVKIYLNGDLIHTGTGVPATVSSPANFSIGGGVSANNPTTDFFIGYIDNFIVHEGVMSDAQIDSLSGGTPF